MYVTVDATLIHSTDVRSVTLLSVTSSEPDNGVDDGNTIDSIEIINDTTLDLRAERSGAGTGRIYTITNEATNVCGTVQLFPWRSLVPLESIELPAESCGDIQDLAATIGED